MSAKNQLEQLSLSMKFVCQLVFPVLLFIFAGCSQADLLQRFASPEDQAFARSYIDDLRRQRFERIEQEMDPSIAGASLRDTLTKMAALIPPGEPSSVTLVGAQSMNMASSSSLNLTFEYDFSGKWLLANVAVKKQGGSNTIVGFHIIPQPMSLAEQNKFSLRGRSFLQYFIFALAITFPLLTFFTLFLCARTKLKGRKWPWIVFILFGFGRLAVNWTTAKWAITPISFQLFSASAFAPLYGQWTLAVSLPVGAVLFLILRGKLRAVSVAGE